jgi:hypothetical protein
VSVAEKREEGLKWDVKAEERKRAERKFSRVSVWFGVGRGRGSNEMRRYEG